MPTSPEDPSSRALRTEGALRGPAAAGRSSRAWRAWLLGALGIASTAFTLASPHLPIDNLATALSPGVNLHALGLDAVAGNFAEGDRLLVILVLDEPASQKAVAPLESLAKHPGVPPIAGLTSAGEQARAEFFWSYAPSFELLEVPAADLRRLYRRAPRSFRVHNGVVLQVWEGVPPAQEFVK